MKLYYSPGACSLSPHIVLREGGFDFVLKRVDLQSGKTGTGRDYKTIQTLGYVPALVQYLADRVPEKRLAPLAGTLARYRFTEWLNFIFTALHKGFGALFNPAFSQEARSIVKAQLETRK